MMRTYVRTYRYCDRCLHKSAASPLARSSLHARFKMYRKNERAIDRYHRIHGSFPETNFDTYNIRSICLIFVKRNGNTTRRSGNLPPCLMILFLGVLHTEIDFFLIYVSQSFVKILLGKQANLNRGF